MTKETLRLWALMAPGIAAVILIVICGVIQVGIWVRRWMERKR